MTKSSNKGLPISVTELREELVKNGWDKRLFKCRDQRKDEIETYELGEREYHTRIVSEHYEDGVLIAISCTKHFHTGNSNTAYWMLRINGTPRYTV